MLMSVIRTAVLYFVVIFCIRIMGKRQIGELQPGELVVTILISELAAIPMQDLNRPISNGVITIFILVILEILISTLTMKSAFFRKIFEGKSAIIIKNGEIDQKMMKKLRMTIDDLLEGLRQAGNFSVDEIDYAIMETNGKISIQQKSAFETVTKKDMKIKTKDKGMPTVVISDGVLQDKVFKDFTTVTKEDVARQLKLKNLTVEQVFLMTVNQVGEYYLVKKEV